MLKNSRELTTPSVIEADICILGCGVAGITLAKELLGSGAKIVMIDAGGESYDELAQSTAKANSFTENYPDPLRTRPRRLGGASNHWANNTSELSSIDFEKRDGLPNSGWEINKSDLAAYYQKGAVYCGVSDDGYDTQYWHDKFSVEPKISKLTSNKLELGMAKAAVPPTRFYQKHGNELKVSNDVTIYTFANLVDMEFSASAKEVLSASFTSSNKVIHKIKAKHFVMAFGGIENARMMLLMNKKYDNKIGNQGDSVGRYFMDHPSMEAAQIFTPDTANFPFFEGGMADDYQRYIINFMQLQESVLRDKELTNIRMPLAKASNFEMSDGISSFHMLNQKIKGKPISGELMGHIANVAMGADMVTEALSRKVFERTLVDDADDFAGYKMPLMMEQTANRDSRITLSGVKDNYGLPRLNVQWQLSEDDKTRLWRGLDVMAREIGALGIGRVRLLKERSARLFGDQIGFGHHHMGTTRMSDTPEKGVVDKNLSVFGVNNLSMAGCSVFATGGHVPPTMTIATLSIRLADFFKESYGVKNNG